ncbi:ankyrin repeat domain-containing protein [Neorickettsia sp. 179522]|uniref:ankyrin repeat domain-containing protein n=1 Tax=Neorickettsia sp. 179522 TaxID=1714371 RepID=UPI000795BDBA|nr:ankyrin repeat domain-containing protein [Neorickettsia sp. 179522]KYH12228.1 hypothetical protein AS219_00090 [Neorickettsia sp. 179522]
MFQSICEVVKKGDVAALASLLRRAGSAEAGGATPSEVLSSAVDPNGCSILQLAVETQNPAILNCVMEALSGDCLAALCARRTGATHVFPECTVLHTAIALGDLKILKLLLDKILSARGEDGGPPSSMMAIWYMADVSGETVLNAAILSGNVKIASLVIEAMKAVEKKMGPEQQPGISLVYASASYDDIRVRGDNGLNKAVSTGDPAMVRVLVNALTSEEVRSLLTRCNLTGDTALDRAAREGNVGILEILFNKLGNQYEAWAQTSFRKVIESSMESRDRTRGLQVAEQFSMRFLSNAIASGNVEAVRRILSPLSVQGRYDLMLRTGWGYHLSPLQLAFSLGQPECVEAMLDSLVTGRGGNKDLVLSMLAQHSGGLTPLHCATDCDSVRLLKKYNLSEEALLSLLTTGSLECSPAAPVFVPDGMNPLQAMLAGPSGDGRPIPRAVDVMMAMLDLLGGKQNLVQRALSSMDGAGRNTLYICASLVGSRGFSPTDFVAVVRYLEDKADLESLLAQLNASEGISALDVICSMEQELYSWGFAVNDCVSRAINRQRRVASRKSLGTGALIDNLAAFCLFCISTIAVVAGAVSILYSKQTDDTGFSTPAVAVMLLASALYLVLLAVAVLLLSSVLKESSDKSVERVAGPMFNNGVFLDASPDISFRPEGVEKVERARGDVRSHRDPLAAFSSSPSASSVINSCTEDPRRGDSGTRSNLPSAERGLSGENALSGRAPMLSMRGLRVEDVCDDQRSRSK